MDVIMFVINVSLAVADLVLSILFSELGRNSDDRSEKTVYHLFYYLRYNDDLLYYTSNCLTFK